MRDAILNGFVDQNYLGSEELGPKILANNQQERIWQNLRQELYSCKSFTWAVAFITQDMLVPFKVIMADLAKNGISGTIITGDYLGFNNPRVFTELQKIPNLEVRIANKAGFHTKGYLFDHENYQTVIIGSANFTRSALLANYEWALKVSSKKQADLTAQLVDKIADLKQDSFVLNSAWLTDYRKNWVKPERVATDRHQTKILPNKMQKAALKQIEALVTSGEKRGLVVSATGTGKTYLGAFAVKKYQPRRFLYIVHREQIAKKSLESFYRVIGGPRSDYGLLTGNRHNLQAKYLFATVQTISQPEMLAPFHYVGVQDYEADGVVIDETTDLRYLASTSRVDYVLKELDYYGYCGTKAKGLVFCSRQDEARELARLFSQKGHPAVALTNEDNEKRRNEVVASLVKGEIEYIVAVDLFNEGIDIPALNQIVMLRNTQSSIVFIQQLGRGLRKYPGKDFTVVLDFIGNYKNNYMIPLALNQDTSRSKDQAKRETRLPSFIDVSTINFSKIASEKILASLDSVKLDGMRELRQSYHDLKNKLGRVPLLFDFYQYGSVAPIVFAQNHGLASYADFLGKMGEDVNLSKYENEVLSFVTKELLNGKRIHELLLLEMLLEQDIVKQEDYLAQLKRHHAYVNDELLASVDAILSLDFFDIKQGKTTKKAQYGKLPLVERSNLFDYQLNGSLRSALDQHDFKNLFVDAIKTGLALNQEYDNQRQFTLYQQYDRKDACRLLNWPKDVSAPMYGYRVGEQDTPIFITYHKDDHEKRNALYRNTLADGRSLRWYTRVPRHLDSDEVQRLLNTRGMNLHIFVKRSDADGKQFFYLGKAKIQADSVREELLGVKKKPAVGMNLMLKHPLSESMHELLFE